MSTYKYQFGFDGDEITGIATVALAVAKASSFGDDVIAMTDNYDGHADVIINEETNEVVCYLADKDAACSKYKINVGESFFSGFTYVGTYTKKELRCLS
ncbi:hypothetical protein [Methylobacter psychrophilus]|uniref:hypothetical protein n=1 Tax=Methylobacter psychrophilus TaxID=96941 RepID=UPI0021D48FCB|nr:hypothetical protein [Methylobacter psychrophilus]